MFLFSSPPSGFNTSYATPSVQISSDGLCAKHIDEEDLGGVLFLDNPLYFKEFHAYFQVRIEQAVSVDDDGLTMGVTLQLPSGELPGCADDVDSSWSIGFNGCAHVDQADSLITGPWNPKDLRRGDMVGFLVANDGAGCVVVNGKKVANMPGLIPTGVTLYGFADLLGNTKGVSFIPDAEPPASLKDFSLQQVQDEAMEALCTAFGTNNPDAVAEPLMIARLVNVSEALIKSAQKALYKGPKVAQAQPKARTAKGKLAAAFRFAMPFGKKKAATAEGDPLPATSPKNPDAERGAYGGGKRTRKGLAGKKAMIKLMVAAQANRTENSEAGGDDVSPAKKKTKATRMTDRNTSGGSVKSNASAKSISKPKKKLSKKPGDSSASTAASDFGGDQAAAKKGLQAALDDEHVGLLRSALASAKDAGVSESDLKKFEAALVELEAKQKNQSLVKDMDDALLTMDPEKVKASIAAAKGGGAEAKEIARVEASLEDMLANKGKTEKLKALGDAVAAKDIKALQSALSAAKSANIGASDLAPYATALKELEVDADRKAKIAAMDAAVTSKDIGKIQAAVKEARSVGVDSGEIARVEEELKKIEALKALDDAIASSDTDKIKKAVDAARSTGADESVLAKAEQAIKDIEVANLRKQKVNNLNQALKEEDIEKTKAALAEAREAGVDANEISRGEEGLKKLEADAAKNMAAKALREALSTEKIDVIKAALADAKEKKVKPDAIADAEKQLKELERKFEEAKKQLTNAVEVAKKTSPPTVDVLQALKNASEAAAARGVDVSEAEALHASLVEALAAAKKAAEEELAASIDGKDPSKITEKIGNAQAFGSHEAVTEALKKMGELIAADMEVAKSVEREEKQAMLPAMEALLNVFRKFAPGDTMLRKLHNDMQDLKGALRVFCRIRPLNKRELALNDVIVVEAKSEMDVTVVSSKGDENAFSYDNVFVETNSQADVFEECRSLIQSCFDGYNITIFTYGQTGAGKTWTLYGIPEQPGVSPRTCTEVFDVVERFRDKFDSELSCAMVELYNSNVRDLLSAEKTPPKLDIKQEKNPDGSMGVKLECTIVPASNTADLETAVGRGFGNRKVASTSMNADSSRSHLLFMIFVKVTDKETGKVRSGKITIVDLAGSERLAKSQVTGDAQKEAIEINKSLTALGDVMMAITSKAKMVPYRNHKLTQLMQDSLGGSAKTLMFVNISPASNNADETINALKYASRARSIENETSKNDGAGKMKTVRKK